jgi:hypothetical protein
MTFSLLLSFERKLGISFALSFVRDNFTANAVSPPAEVTLAMIKPMLAKQNGHIASPLVRVAKRDRFAASIWMTRMEGRFLHQSRKKLRAKCR